ncbi:hypothetical protein SOVF_023580 isoform A, partial [Spinacia oleracea]
LLSLPARLISSLLLRAPPTSLALLPLNTDATILIPMLSSLSKNKVFPMVPRVVGLPLDKFQQALAHTLQVTDACTTCFEQRTVITQHVLEKALNQMRYDSTWSS